MKSGSLPGVTLMLHSDPQFVHFGEVKQNEINRIVNRSTRKKKR